MPAVELTYHDRGERGFDRLMGSRWQGAGTAWLNEEEKRIRDDPTARTDRVRWIQAGLIENDCI